jgi:hypothetical protein
MNMAILGTSDFWQYEYRHLKFDNSFAIVKDTAYIVRNEKGAMSYWRDEGHNIPKKTTSCTTTKRRTIQGAFLHSAAGMAIVSNEGYHIEVNAG